MIKQDRSVGGWAHDFRTVAASLLNYADLYSVSGCTKEQFLDGVRSNCGWFLELIDGMSDHLDGDEHVGLVSSESAVPALRSMVDSVADVHRLAIQKLGIRLIIDIERDVNSLAPRQVVIIKRILSNLLSNAIRHSQGHAVLIRIARAASSDRSVHEDLCVLEVQDFGTGITRQQVKRLMQHDIAAEPRRNSTRQRRGLATTRQLVECLGGKLSIQSQFGKGTRFSVEFVPGQALNKMPERQKPDSTIDAFSQTDSIMPRSGTMSSAILNELTVTANGLMPNVLLIDDDPDLRSLVTAVLMAEGIRTFAVADEQRAMNCKLTEFDCVLLDLNLGNVKGCDVARRLRQAGFVRPILALTAEPVAKLSASEQRFAMDEFDGWIDKTEGGCAVAKRLRQVLCIENG